MVNVRGYSEGLRVDGDLISDSDSEDMPDTRTSLREAQDPSVVRLVQGFGFSNENFRIRVLGFGFGFGVWGNRMPW